MPDAARIRFLPGVPGLELSPEMLASNPYPDTAVDLLKLMRSYGADVDFSHSRDQRADVGHRSADIWLPILSFAGTSGLGVAFNILSNALYDLYVKRHLTSSDEGMARGAADPRLHVEIQYNSTTGEKTTRLSGSATDVIAAIRELSGSADD